MNFIIIDNKKSWPDLKILYLVNKFNFNFQNVYRDDEINSFIQD